MRGLFFIFLFLPMLYGCQQEVEVYNESNITKSDTLNVEQIKIQTH